MKYFLKISYVYQIIIWLINIYYYVIGFLDQIRPQKSPTSLISSFGIIVFSIVVIASNLFLLLNGASEKAVLKNLKFNKWINLVQGIHFSLLGFSLAIYNGVYVILFYSYVKQQQINIAYAYENFVFDESFDTSNLDVVFLAFNIVPLILFAIFNSAINKKTREFGILV